MKTEDYILIGGAILAGYIIYKTLKPVQEGAQDLSQSAGGVLSAGGNLLDLGTGTANIWSKYGQEVLGFIGKEQDKLFDFLKGNNAKDSISSKGFQGNTPATAYTYSKGYSSLPVTGMAITGVTTMMSVKQPQTNAALIKQYPYSKSGVPMINPVTFFVPQTSISSGSFVSSSSKSNISQKITTSQTSFSNASVNALFNAKYKQKYTR